MSAPLIPGPTKEPSPVRLVVTLGLAGLLSGAALATVYDVTAPMIAANRAREMRAAVFEVVPGAETVHGLAVQDGSVVTTPGDVTGEEAAFVTYDAQGNLLGYAIPAEGSGFQDTISLIFGFDPATKKVLGMRVLESRETPGLGDKIYKDAHFVGEFHDLSVDPSIVVVKKGEGTADNQVDGITGATISSKSVVKILNAALDEWRPRLPAEGPGGTTGG